MSRIPFKMRFCDLLIGKFFTPVNNALRPVLFRKISFDKAVNLCEGTIERFNQEDEIISILFSPENLFKE